MTVDKLLRAKARLEKAVETQGGFGTMDVIFSTRAMESTTERLFPASRYRSARVRKKLMKKYGGEFRKRPCIWRQGGRFICHPSLKPELLRALGEVTT